MPSSVFGGAIFRNASSALHWISTCLMSIILQQITIIDLGDLLLSSQYRVVMSVTIYTYKRGKHCLIHQLFVGGIISHCVFVSGGV